MTAVRVRLPHHLRTLARLDGPETVVDVEGPPTIRAVLDAVEARHPMLVGTIRDHATGERRAYLRLFAAGADLSHDAQETELPGSVSAGEEPFIVLGAIAGG